MPEIPISKALASKAGRETDFAIRTLFGFQIALGIFALAFAGYAGFVLGPKVNKLMQEKVELSNQIASMTAQLQESTNLLRNARNVTLMDAKQLMSYEPCQARVLARTLELRDQNVRWKVGGVNPEQGFDSPNFAAYVLNSEGLLPEQQLKPEASAGIAREQARLMTMLPSEGNPSDGDVVFYKTGYTMFYFTGVGLQEGVPLAERGFVVGMTPFGVVALTPDFAQRIGVGRVDYSKIPKESCY